MFVLRTLENTQHHIQQSVGSSYKIRKYKILLSRPGCEGTNQSAQHTRVCHTIDVLEGSISREAFLREVRANLARWTKKQKLAERTRGTQGSEDRSNACSGPAVFRKLFIVLRLASPQIPPPLSCRLFLLNLTCTARTAPPKCAQAAQTPPPPSL